MFSSLAPRSHPPGLAAATGPTLQESRAASAWRASVCIAALLLVVSFVPSAHGQSPYALFGVGRQAGGPAAGSANEEPEVVLRRILDAWAAQQGLSGTVLAAYDSEVRLEQGYGFASIELGVPNTPLTRHRLNFLTMQLTAAALGVLAERGTIDLDRPLGAYLPGAPVAAREVPLRALLTTESGLEQSLWHYTEKGPHDRFGGFDELLDVLARVDAHAEPGVRRAFSGTDGSSTDYLLLGAVVEAVSGERYEDFVRRHVFQPLGMTDSGFLTEPTPVRKLAYPYRSVLGHLEPHPTVDYSMMPSVGAAYATARDVLRFVRGVVEEGRLGERAREVVMMSFGASRGALVDGRWVRDVEGVPPAEVLTVLGTNGWIQGSTMTLVHFVGRQHTFIVLSNVQGASQIYDMQRRWAHTVFGLPVGLPEPRVERRMWATLLRDGSAAAEDIYRRHRAASHMVDLPLPDAIEGNLRTLRSKGRHREARSVGELLVRLDTTRWAGFYELGETLRQAGDAAGAGEAFARALALNPDDPFAVSRMRELVDGGREPRR